MAISRKGRRRIVVGGRVFYWDYRIKGNKPGQGPIWDWPAEQRPSVVRVVSEDKRWRLTFESHAGDNGGRVQIEPGAKTFRFVDSEPRRSPRWVITPAYVRRLIEKYSPR